MGGPASGAPKPGRLEVLVAAARGWPGCVSMTTCSAGDPPEVDAFSAGWTGGCPKPAPGNLPRRPRSSGAPSDSRGPALLLAQRLLPGAGLRRGPQAARWAGRIRSAWGPGALSTCLPVRWIRWIRCSAGGLARRWHQDPQPPGPSPAQDSSQHGSVSASGLRLVSWPRLSTAPATPRFWPPRPRAPGRETSPVAGSDCPVMGDGVVLPRRAGAAGEQALQLEGSSGSERGFERGWGALTPWAPLRNRTRWTGCRWGAREPLEAGPTAQLPHECRCVGSVTPSGASGPPLGKWSPPRVRGHWLPVGGGAEGAAHPSLTCSSLGPPLLVHTHTHSHLCTHAHTVACTHMHTCVRAVAPRACRCSCAHLHLCTLIYMHTHSCVWACSCALALSHAHTHTLMCTLRHLQGHRPSPHTRRQARDQASGGPTPRRHGCSPGSPPRPTQPPLHF